MNTPFNSDELARAEVCFAVASQLLYVEPNVASVAEQAASRQFACAPFGEDSEDVREGLRLLDGWCADALHAAEVTDGADEADGVDAAALLVESPHSPSRSTSCVANGCACSSVWVHPRRQRNPSTWS